MTKRSTFLAAATLVPALALLAACGGGDRRHGHVAHDELDCMTRAMFFESHRSSRDGLIAVGSVVMNRVESSDFPNTVCGVVGQRNQFAPGVLTREMNSRAMPEVTEAAVAVLLGERHPRIQNAQFFHAASYHANYNNIHYVLTAGGNAFYEKRRPEHVTRSRPPRAVEGLTGG